MYSIEKLALRMLSIIYSITTLSILTIAINNYLFAAGLDISTGRMIAISFIYCMFGFVIYTYGKIYIIIYLNLLKKDSYILLFEYFILPVLTLFFVAFLLSISYEELSKKYYFDLYVLIPIIIAFILLSDVHHLMRKFIYKENNFKKTIDNAVYNHLPKILFLERPPKTKIDLLPWILAFLLFFIIAWVQDSVFPD